MIKARVNDKDILIGLSDENIKRLKKGKPIKFNLSELGLGDSNVYIVQGKTEQSIAVSLGINTEIKTRGQA